MARYPGTRCLGDVSEGGARLEQRPYSVCRALPTRVNKRKHGPMQHRAMRRWVYLLTPCQFPKRRRIWNSWRGAWFACTQPAGGVGGKITDTMSVLYLLVRGLDSEKTTRHMLEVELPEIDPPLPPIHAIVRRHPLNRNVFHLRFGGYGCRTRVWRSCFVRWEIEQ